MSPAPILTVLQFAFATLLPVIVGTALTICFDRGPLRKLGYVSRQVLVGVIFGLVAIFGTEFGIKLDGAVMNVRDAAPLVAGLFFGGPAGVIAGLIGGIERWFAAMWGAGDFTRLACSLGTIFAGVFAALLDFFLFKTRKPTWSLALAIGVVTEVMHMLLVYTTNLNDLVRAAQIVQVCTGPMVLCTGISVALASIGIALACGSSIRRGHEKREISQIIQMGMLSAVAVVFVLTVGFIFMLQQGITHTTTINDLKEEISEVKNEIIDISDSNLLELTRKVAAAVPSVSAADTVDLDELARNLDVSTIDVVDASGIVVASNVPEAVGFDMHSSEQSREFLDLLPSGRTTYYVQDYQPMTSDVDQYRKFAGVRVEGGFVQAGYDTEQYVEDILSQVRATVANRYLGVDGFLIVTTGNGTVIGKRKNLILSNTDVEAIEADADKAPAGELFWTNLHGLRYYAIHQEVEGFRAVAMIPLEEANQERDLSVLVTSFMEILVFAVLFVAIFVLIRHVVVNNIMQVNGTLNTITSGDLEAKVAVRDSVEFASLSDDINRTVAALRDAIAAEGKRIEKDLATAKAIQESALPRKFPPFPDVQAFDIYASMNAAREVGGDFYDFFLIGDHTLGFLIADVSGKGIPASLFMMAAKSELANYMKRNMDLADAVRNANWNLCQRNEAFMFVTVWAAKLDYRTGELTYVNAGHNPPLLRHDGSWQWVHHSGDTFLGMFENATYTSETIQLDKDDELLLYTDGVNEAFSADGEEYGNDRLEAFLSEHVDLRPRAIVDALRANLSQWSKGAEQSDDITILSLEYGVPPEDVS